MVRRTLKTTDIIGINIHYVTLCHIRYYKYNDLLAVSGKAITCTNVDLLSIGALGKKTLSDILVKLKNFHSRKVKVYTRW